MLHLGKLTTINEITGHRFENKMDHLEKLGRSKEKGNKSCNYVITSKRKEIFLI